MAKVTIYIANELESQVKEMAGSWDHFPTLEEIRANQGQDLEREVFNTNILIYL